MLRKGKSAEEGNPEKSWSGAETEAGAEQEQVGFKLAWWQSTERKASHLLGLRERHQYSDQHSNRNRAPCVASTPVGTDGEEDQITNRQCKESS